MGTFKPAPWAGILLWPIGSYLSFISMRSQLPGGVLVGMFGAMWTLWQSIRSAAYVYQFARDRKTGRAYATLAAQLHELSRSERHLIHLEGDELVVRVRAVDGIFDGDICVTVVQRVYEYNPHTYHNDEFVIENTYLLYGIHRKIELSQRTRKRVIGVDGKLADIPIGQLPPLVIESKRLSRQERKRFDTLTQVLMLTRLQAITAELQRSTALET